jgi:hypothetical protein
MRVNESGQNNFAAAVELNNLILPNPSIPQSIFGFSNRYNLAARAQHSPIFNNAEFLQFFPSPRAPAISRLHRDKLPDAQ